MEANEAPDKIYINPNFEHRIWLMGKGDSSFIEYVSPDTFIKKALRWMISKGGINDVLSGEMIEDFKDYMKGE